MPSVSVVVAAYNVEDYIEACVASLENQTYGPLEIIVVDDGSSDSTGAILSRLASAEGSRTTVLTQENAGLSVARNNGLQLSAGELVCFVDGDDQVAPEMVESLVNALKLTGADLASSGHSVYSPGDNPMWSDAPYRVRTLDQPRALEETLYYRGAGTNAWAKLAPRAIWMEHTFPSRLLYEDLATIPGVIADCASIAVLDAKLYGFAVRPGSITRTNDVRLGRVKDLVTAINMCEASEPRHSTPELAAAFKAREASELCRVLNLADQVADGGSEIVDLRRNCRSRLLSIAPQVLCDLRAPLELRLRVAMTVLVPRLYHATWRIKKAGEGWL